MWLLRLPLPPDQRVRLPPGRHLFPWYFKPEETSRLAELLTSLLDGVDRHVILPWPAARALVSTPGHPPMVTTLVVVTFDDTSVDDAAVDNALARIDCPSTMLQLPRPREGGYAWQERHVKPALVTLLQENLGNEEHPLAPLNIAALPVRLAASLTTDVLGLVELLEAAVEHRLAHAAEGTSDADYEASLYAAAGRQFAERLLRLRPYQVEAALEVVMAEGVGAWSDERFRTGAEALEEVGLAQVAGGSVSLGPMARRAKDARILLVLTQKMSSSLSISLPRRWVVETAPILDDRRPAYSPNDRVASTDAGTLAAAHPPPAPLIKSADRVKKWIHNGSDFKDRCRRAQDFLSDPNRSKTVRTDRYSEYDIWVEPIRCEFTEDEWTKINSIYVDDRLYDEPAILHETEMATDFRGNPRSTFRGFKALDRKRFSSQQELSKEIDAFLDKRGGLKIDLARWMTFAFTENITREERPLLLDLLSWIWRSAIESPVDDCDLRHEAHDAMRRCLALALKNGYQQLQDHILEDARAIGLNLSGVVAAGERPLEFLQKMKAGFEKMLDGSFPDARRAYEQAGVIAQQRGDAFGEWAAFHGEEDAVLASIDLMDRVKEESQSLIEDYRRRRSEMEQGSRVKEWIEQARQRRERVIQKIIEGYIKRNRRRMTGGRSMSFSNYPHDYWTMFRDLETIDAPPNLQRTYVQPLIDLGGFDPEEEFRYRLQLDLDSTEKTEEWVSRIVDEREENLEDRQKQNSALLKEFTRGNLFKGERLRRLEIFPAVADIFRLEDLDWSLSFFRRCQEDMRDDKWTHRNNHYYYVGALLSYAKLETRSVAIDRLEEYAATAASQRNADELARGLGRRLPLEQWVGLHPDAAERLTRLALDLARGFDEHEVSSSSEEIAWALYHVVHGVNRFGRPFPDAMKDEIRAWANRLLHKEIPGEHSYLQGALNPAARLGYVLAPNDAARDDVVKEALDRAAGSSESPSRMGPTLEGPMGLWISLVEAGVSPTGIAMAEVADSLWAKLDGAWDETLRFVRNNSHHAWSYMAFLAEVITSYSSKNLPVARDRLLLLVQAAPEQMPLCAKTLDPKFWGNAWQPFIDQVWRLSGGGDGPDPVAARTGAVDLLGRWVAQSPVGSNELPSELTFLVDLTLLALLDESPVVANHAAYNVVGYAARARAPAEVLRVVSALRRLATDSRLGVRGAAAYAGKKLSSMDVADDIRIAAQEIDKVLSGETYAVMYRQQRFGELDGSYPFL